jgi:hypothetical protein
VKSSLWSDGSCLSVGSQGSFLSIASVGSALSIGSVGSFGSAFSVGLSLSLGSVLCWRSRSSVMSSSANGALLGRTDNPRAVGSLAGLLVALTACLIARGALRR